MWIGALKFGKEMNDDERLKFLQDSNRETVLFLRERNIKAIATESISSTQDLIEYNITGADSEGIYIILVICDVNEQTTTHCLHFIKCTT